MIKRVYIRNGQIFRRLSSHPLWEGACSAALDQATNIAKNEVQVLMTPNVKTGEMRNSVIVTKLGPKKAHIGSSVDHTLYVDQGTGIHGPNNSPIVPKTAKLMKWLPVTATGKPGGSAIYARKTAGQTPQLFSREHWIENYQQCLRHSIVNLCASLEMPVLAATEARGSPRVPIGANIHSNT